MAVIGIQGVRGGTGTTSIVAGLGWSLQQLGESVLLIDGTSDNLLRLFFNIGFDKQRGWARDYCDGANWRESAWRYTQNLDVLPFGQLMANEHQNPNLLTGLAPVLTDIVSEIRAARRYRWILLDIPTSERRYNHSLLALSQQVLAIANPDLNCHVRLHQQPLAANSHIVINNLQVASQLQDDLYQIWRMSQRQLVPVALHRDEALSECLAAKQPVGEYQPESLASQELLTLANWCLLRFAGERHD